MKRSKRPRSVAFIAAVAAASFLIVLFGAVGLQALFQVIGWQIPPAFDLLAMGAIVITVGIVWDRGTRERDDK